MMTGETAQPQGFSGSQRDAFEMPAGVAYFNTASLAPQLHRVRHAGEAALRARGRPWDIASEEWFVDVDRLRAGFGRIIGSEPDGIALVPATSYGFATAARNIPLSDGDRILVLADEYPSGVYTWQAAARASGAEIVTVSREDGQTWTEAVLTALDERAAVVSVPNVHWTDGAIIDLPAVADRARAVDARLIIDGSQSVGAMPIDVQTLKPDFVVSVGYKWLLGPFSVSYLYVAERYRDGQPLEQNWISRAESQDFARLVDYRDEYQPGARRFDVGQRTSFELVPMAVAAIEQILEWGVAGIADHLATITGEIGRAGASLGLDVAPAQRRGPHMLGVGLPARIRDDAVTVLAQAGCHAAIRGGSLRIAPHLHITEGDVAQLLAALEELAARL
jgi:selenocysteine lyase/cysteine desulfurase